MSGQHPCELVAIDLDGTLLDPAGRVPERNRRALHAAHDAGMRVVLCTGRSYTETRPVLDELALELDATVTVSGALVTDVPTGATLEAATITRELAEECGHWFADAGYTTMWLHDASRAGFDGYIVPGVRRHAAIDRWLEMTPCRFRQLDALLDNGPLPLRVTVVDETELLEELAIGFVDAFGRRMTHNVIHVPTYDFTVIEAFSTPVDKWYGIQRLCRRWEIDPRNTAAIGDDVNDVPMLLHAGRSAAVANARPAARNAAREHVTSNADGGVAEWIERLLRTPDAP